MKRILILLLTLSLLCGCAASPAANTQNTQPSQAEEENPMKTDLTEKFVAAPGETLPAEKTYSFGSKDIPEYKTGDLVLVTLEVKANTGVKKLDAHLYQGGVEGTDVYFIPAQWTRLVLCSDPAAQPVGLKLAAEEGIALRSLTVENVKKADPLDMGDRLGQFLVDDFQKIELPEAGVGAGRTTDLVKSGSYIYSIGAGSFTVTDVSDPAAPKVCGTVSGLGNTRQIALLESGTDVMITARGFGAYIIDASNPNAPRIRCTYDTLEMGTGICISGRYAYISNRQYGVEIVDLSNPDHPQYVCTVPTGEVQSAQVFDGRLYCGLYGEHRVDIYDLTAAEPKKIGEVLLSGRGDGLSVAKDGERTLLYAATGHHSVKKLAAKTPVSELRFGQGNGMDIVDVTDPAAPKWLSTVRCDGRFYHSSHDYWEAHVSEADGHRYAHVVSTYNGLYIYNVDDPTAPVRVAHVTVPIDQASPNYTLYKSNIRTIVFPFDKYKGIQSPFGAMVCDGGVLYLAGVLTDLHILPMEQLGSGVSVGAKQLTHETAAAHTYPAFDPEGQVHAVISDGKQLYAACGTDGIAVLDPNLKLKSMHPAKGTCYDVHLFEGVLYSAEGRAGLAAYDAASMEELWRYAPEGKVIKQVRLSPKGRFALLHSGDTEASVVRLEDLTEVYSRRTNSQMYHHNISSTLINGRYLCFWAQSTNEVWLDFGEEDDRMVPVELTEYVSRTNMLGGVVEYRGKALNMTTTGYILYDPTQDPTNLPALGGMTGKPTVSGDLLIVANRVKGKVYFVDISNPEDPRTKDELLLPGNPDIVLVAHGSVYVPCGNAGLIKLSMR